MEYKNKMQITLLVMLVIFTLINYVAYQIRNIEKNTALEIMEIALDSASEDVQRYFNIQREVMIIAKIRRKHQQIREIPLTED